MALLRGGAFGWRRGLDRRCTHEYWWNTKGTRSEDTDTTVLHVPQSLAIGYLYHTETLPRMQYTYSHSTSCKPSEALFFIKQPTIKEFATVLENELIYTRGGEGAWMGRPRECHNWTGLMESVHLRGFWLLITPTTHQLTAWNWYKISHHLRQEQTKPKTTQKVLAFSFSMYKDKCMRVYKRKGLVCWWAKLWILSWV